MEIFEEILIKIFLPTSGIVAMLMFSWPLKRRKLFWLRLVGFVALYFGLDYLSSLVSFNLNNWWHGVYNVASFFVLSASLLLLYAEKYFTLLFCGISGKCTMHIAEYLSKILFNYTVKNTYLSIAVYAAVYVFIYFVFARKIRSEDCGYLSNFKQIVFALIAVLATDFIILSYGGTDMNSTVNIFVFFLITIICFVILCLQFNLLAESRQKLEAALLSQIREKEHEQYEISKENINLIGIRQHDLKNMLESRNIGLPESELNEIVKSLDGYDLPFRTGNRTLDIILMEKSLVCKSLNIRIECLADGTALGRMSEMDIYSLFLNALNNAIESAKKINEEDKRVIWLKTFTRGDLLFIQVQNYYNEIVRSDKGFSTTKSDKANHGYGLKSMKMIAEKYGGDMSAKTENDMFFLGFVIPVNG